MGKPFSIDLMPAAIDRNGSPHVLPPTLARILQAMDPTYLVGRLVRGKGSARTQIEGSATTVTNAFVGRRPDCRQMVFDNSTGGVIRLTVGDGSVLCAGPLPEWMDSADLEDAGVDPPVAGSSS